VSRQGAVVAVAAAVLELAVLVAQVVGVPVPLPRHNPAGLESKGKETMADAGRQLPQRVVVEPRQRDQTPQVA
jgi:hypothetical protein